MKKIIILAAALSVTSAMAADVYVQPHYNKNGTYVEGHHRSAPDSNPYNNYSSQGNINPYTGQAGTVNPYAQPSPSYPAYQLPQPNYQQVQPRNYNLF